MDKIDVAIIGAGVVGLAIAWELSKRKKQTVLVLEKNKKFGQETSSRNSEVIHSGIYYLPEMLKSKLCVEGNALLYHFCEHNKIWHQRCGKLIISTNDTNNDGFEELYKRAQLNNVNVIKMTRNQVSDLEPDIYAEEIMLLPNTGIIDAHKLMQALYYQGREQGAIYLFDSMVQGIDYTGSDYLIKTQKETIKAETVINSSGLEAEKIASYLGIDTQKCGYRLYMCKGEYFKLKKRFKIKRLVYPLPLSNSLGIHLSLDNEGNLRLGPNAIYVNEVDYSVDERDKAEFYRAARVYLPKLCLEDLSPDFAGIRPKLQAPGEAIKDFVIKEESNKGFPGFINLIGIESPGLTSCLAIAKYVNKILNKK